MISIEAVRAIQARRSKANTQTHGALNDSAICLGLLGFYAIYSRKDGLEKPHLTSWHSWFGILALFGFSLNAMHGMLRTLRLSHVFFGTSNGFQWIWVSRFHRVLGAGSHVIAAVATILGLYSGWGINNLGGTVAFVLSICVIVGELAILSLVQVGDSKSGSYSTSSGGDSGIGMECGSGNHDQDPLIKTI